MLFNVISGFHNYFPNLAFIVEWQFSPGCKLKAPGEDVLDEVEPLIILHRGLTRELVCLSHQHKLYPNVRQVQEYFKHFLEHAEAHQYQHPQAEEVLAMMYDWSCLTLAGQDSGAVNMTCTSNTSN